MLQHLVLELGLEEVEHAAVLVVLLDRAARLLLVREAEHLPRYGGDLGEICASSSCTRG